MVMAAFVISRELRRRQPPAQQGAYNYSAPPYYEDPIVPYQTYPGPWHYAGNLISASVVDDTVLRLYARDTGSRSRPYEYSVVLNEQGDGPRVLLDKDVYYDLQNGDTVMVIPGLESVGAWTVVTYDN
jgi:hypothetical protein